MVSTLAIANFGLAKLDFTHSTMWLKVSVTTVLQLEGPVLTQFCSYDWIILVKQLRILEHKLFSINR